MVKKRVIYFAAAFIFLSGEVQGENFVVKYKPITKFTTLPNSTT